MTLFESELEPQQSAPTGPTVRVRLTVAYDGTGFHGFAAQPRVPTVAGALGDAIATVTRERVDITCAGRTDAGVHARGQVVHFDIPEGTDVTALQRALNKLLRPRIAIRSAEVVAESFDARHSATGRRYRYTVLNAPVHDPLLAATAWHVPEPLDLRAMQLACDPLYGEHDFAAFCRKAEGKSTVRRVNEAVWRDLGGGLLRFEIAANAFCHQMVRSVVGTLVDVGLGRKRAGDMTWVLRSGDRANAGQVAPPHGLVLWEVTY